MNPIGNKIKSLMLMKGININKLCELTKLDRYQIDNIILGRTKRITLIQIVAKALNVSLDYLCEVPENLENINLSESEAELYSECFFYIDAYTKGYGLELSNSCREKIFYMLKDHNPEFDLSSGALAGAIHGIILLLKNHPDFAKKLTEKS